MVQKCNFIEQTELVSIYQKIPKLIAHMFLFIHDRGNRSLMTLQKLTYTLIIITSHFELTCNT